jgi:DNA-binding MarR family transcriptional regulator
MRGILQQMAFPRIELTGTASCAAFNLRRTSRVVTALYDAALAASGLSSPQVTILIGVAKSEPVPVGVLANILLADHTTLTRSLALLSRKGLVSVSPRSTMRRRLVSLTAKGSTALARSVRRWREIQTDFVSSFGEPRWKETRNALEELAAVAVRLKAR